MLPLVAVAVAIATTALGLTAVTIVVRARPALMNFGSPGNTSLDKPCCVLLLRIGLGVFFSLQIITSWA